MSNRYNVSRQQVMCSHLICDGWFCLKEKDPNFTEIILRHNISPLGIPIVGGFQRMVVEQTCSGQGIKKVVWYSKNGNPGERNKKDTMESMDEVHKYIQKLGLNLTVDLFCFNPSIDVSSTLRKEEWNKISILEDLSNNKNPVPIGVINSADKDIPDFENYSVDIIYADHVVDDPSGKNPENINVIFTCCDCDDDCRDKSKCSCFQQTLLRYNPKDRKKLGDDKIGYDFKSLTKERTNMSGIYECNSECRCNKSCVNRVIQNGSKWRLQLYKNAFSKVKGWSVRTLNDIPKGAFISTYSGKIIHECFADMISQKWETDSSWRYFVHLQVEQYDPCNQINEFGTLRRKPGRKKKIINRNLNRESPDSGFDASFSSCNQAPLNNISEGSSEDQEKPSTSRVVKLPLRNSNVLNKISKHRIIKKRGRKPGIPNPKNITLMSINKRMKYKAIMLGQEKRMSNENGFVRSSTTEKRLDIASLKFFKKKPNTSTLMGIAPRSSVIVPRRLNSVVHNWYEKRKKDHYIVTKRELEIAQPPVKIERVELDETARAELEKKQLTTLKPVVKLQILDFSSKNGNESFSLFGDKNEKKMCPGKGNVPKARKMIKTINGNPEMHSPDVFVLDGREKGNIGKYFNHSCDPNMFPQYVFYLTQDIRFPSVGFFASRDIRAGEELTWNYNYEKKKNNNTSTTIECMCNADKCSGRFC